MITISAPSTVANPITSGFNINYTLGGSKLGLASAQVTFYMSTTSNGSSGVFQLASFQILLNHQGSGVYGPPSGTQTRYISASGLPSNTYALWQSIVAGCQPQSWYILGRVDFNNIVSTSSSMGTTKQPDFYFTGGTISPATISPGGTTNISFDLYTQCPVTSTSTVGIYLTDATYSTALAYIGGISIGTGSGTFSLPPMPITFSPSIATGTYGIVLIADEDGVVAESNESNNVGAFDLNVTSPLTAIHADSGEQKLNTEIPFAPEQYDPRMGPAEYIVPTF
ncbi:hypothetical protein [Hyalangium rubrum]|uniref:CARDB domain-containing protein n=1 Tax=Hyalangium rubrum TaxID=3103134 RepID=A0ABU5H214_9BACT|nr:hypothetical protein [Hyalangium sp. s54d21]MDY7227508.1 hypothetical protein [Hyalangium sp. s54d21]